MVRRLFRKAIIAAVAVIGLSALAACGGEAQPLEAEGTATPAQATGGTGRCMPVNEAVVQAFRAAITLEGGQFRDIWGVKSNEVSNIFYVSAEVDGPGLEGDGHIATWATSSLDYISGTVSINEVAIKNSSWVVGTQKDIGYSMEVEGAEVSQQCTRSRGAG